MVRGSHLLSLPAYSLGIFHPLLFLNILFSPPGRAKPGAAIHPDPGDQPGHPFPVLRRCRRLQVSGKGWLVAPWWHLGGSSTVGAANRKIWEFFQDFFGFFLPSPHVTPWEEELVLPAFPQGLCLVVGLSLGHLGSSPLRILSLPGILGPVPAFPQPGDI